jgi:hypothetical protein
LGVFYQKKVRDEIVCDMKGNIVKKESYKLDRPVAVMKKIEAKQLDATEQLIKGLNFNLKSFH